MSAMRIIYKKKQSGGIIKLYHGTDIFPFYQMFYFIESKDVSIIV